jgi:hypothetical protein
MLYIPIFSALFDKTGQTDVNVATQESTDNQILDERFCVVGLVVGAYFDTQMEH